MNPDQWSSFRRLPAGQRWALAVVALSALWMSFVLAFGGIDTSIFGLRIRSTDWSDPAILGLIGLVVFARLQQRMLNPSARTIRGVVADAVRRWLTVDGLFLTAILILAAVVRLWGLPFGLPHPSARPDEDAVASIAGGYFGGNFNPHGFNYPPLFMIVVAGTMWLVLVRLPSILARLNIRVAVPELTIPFERIVARLLSATAGVVGVWLVFRIGLRLFGRATAFIGAIFLALAFLHVRDSHFGVTDIPMTCLVLVGFLAIAKLSESGSTGDLVAAGCLTGLAVATKYNAILLSLPASLAILNDPMRRPLTQRFVRLVVFGLFLTLAFLIICPWAVLTPEKFFADFMFEARHLHEGHGVDLGRGFIYHVTTTLRYGLGIPLFAAGVLGLGMMIRRERIRGVLFALFPVAYYVLIGTGRTVFARYTLPAVPFLCLAAGYAVATAATWLTNMARQPARRVPAMAAITAAILWPSAMSVIAFDRLLAREDTRVVARRWVEARFAPGATMTQIGASNGHLYAYYEHRYVLSEELSNARPTVIVVVSSPISGIPDLAVDAPWLRREYDLQFEEQVVANDDPANTYDRQDEFFLPIGGFHQIERPGPNVQIFVHRDDDMK